MAAFIPWALQKYISNALAASRIHKILYFVLLGIFMGIQLNLYHKYYTNCKSGSEREFVLL